MQIILIGMPGCGKTTVGRMLAAQCECVFLDLDEEIEQNAGKKITTIFAEEGEIAFRRLETDVLKKVLDKDNIVIATGGGIVTQKENRDLLTGKNVIFLDRPVEQILTDVEIKDRPLLADGKEKVRQLFSQRYAFYVETAAVRIVNDMDAETAVGKIRQALCL